MRGRESENVQFLFFIGKAGPWEPRVLLNSLRQQARAAQHM